MWCNFHALPQAQLHPKGASSDPEGAFVPGHEAGEPTRGQSHAESDDPACERGRVCRA
jgi:hypothetical protein